MAVQTDKCLSYFARSNLRCYGTKVHYDLNNIGKNEIEALKEGFAKIDQV